MVDWFRAVRFACIIGMSVVSMSAATPAKSQAVRTVGLELVLLIDVSASVNQDEFRLQARGLGAAFASDPVREAIRLAAGGIAISVIQWANGENQQVALDWTHVQSDGDALWLAGQLAAMPRLIDGGHTALGNALEIALHELDTNGYDGVRRVIDLSGDGRSNDGAPLRTVRKQVLERGITINGLAIMNELPLLERYFKDYLIGGEGAFVLSAMDYVDFARAIREKLEREIRSSPLTKYRAPDVMHASVPQAVVGSAP